MRIAMNDTREILFEELESVAQSNTKSGAIDEAVKFYLEMAGGNQWEVNDGRLDAIMIRAVEQGSVTPEELAELLSTDQIPIQYEHRHRVGHSD